MYYFSYGSFLDSDTLRKHCPSAKFVTRAILPDYEVKFNFMSNTYKAGVTGVEVRVGKNTHGVVYELPLKEIEYLDLIEGVPEGDYFRQTVEVVDDEGKSFQVEIYRTSNPKGPFQSNRTYVIKMLNGAREHSLAPEYIKELEDLYQTLPEGLIYG